MTPADSRSYVVWRRDARQPFRTYRVRRGRPAPADHNVLGQWPDRAAALRVQKAANAATRTGRRAQDPGQQILFPEFFAGFAGAAAE